MTVTRTRLTTKAATVEQSLRNALEPARLVLPYPPSINALYRAVKGRSILSQAYRDWIKQAGMEIMLQRPKRTLGKVGISISLKAPDKRRRDLDNVGGKAILDLLVRHSLIEGDDSRYIRSLCVRWVDVGVPCEVIIRPELS